MMNLHSTSSPSSISANRNQKFFPVLLLFTFLLPACISPTPTPENTFLPWFREISKSAGVEFQHVRATSSKFYFPEIMAGGVGWIDYDNDGFLDLYLVQGGDIDAPHNPVFTNKLYRNTGGSKFIDVTSETGVGDTGYGMGLATGDIDNDGDVDLYVTNVGANVLYQNNGDGSFTDISKTAGVDHSGWGSSAAFADFNSDGLLDLYVVNYVKWAPNQEIECFSGGAGRDYCHPDNYRAPAADVLYMNDGNGHFSDVSDKAGITRTAANGLGVFPADYDNDGLLDLYVANDGNPNFLWINKGDGSFEDRALLAGVAVNRQGTAEAGMGVVSFDVEGDGDLDILLTHLRDETNTFYRNEQGIFQDATISAGLSSASLPFTGFGISVADFDFDGNLDLYVANGRVGRGSNSNTADPFAEPNQVFQGTATNKFTEIVPQGGTVPQLIMTSRGTAMADFDNDGDEDLAIVNSHGPAHLLENIVEKKGAWIGFDLSETTQGKALIPYYNALISVETSNRSFHRLVQSAGSYQSANDTRVRVGIPEGETITAVNVRWPNSTTSNFGALETGKYHKLHKPE